VSGRTRRKRSGFAIEAGETRSGIVKAATGQQLGQRIGSSRCSGAGETEQA
jgi:hypothetical protein